MQSMNLFCSMYNVTASVERAVENPWMDANAMPQGSTHFKVTLRARFDRQSRQLTTYYSMGPAHYREPTAADVLDCLSSDAAGVEAAYGFEDWANEYGYDTDIRTAERTFRTVKRQAKRLKQFAGDHYSELLYETERM